jgi:MYXO-CTERM domain-containing protein
VASIEAGFASWSAPSCTSFQAVNQGNTSSQNTAQDQQNTILWRSGTWPGQLGSVNSTIGVTLTSFSGTTNFDADIVFNNVGFSWDNSGKSGNNVDTQSIATHEQGHFLGLDHTPPQSAIMYAAYTGGIKRNLSGDDTQGVCALYPCTTGDCGSGGSSGAGGSGGSGGSGGGSGQTCGQCQEQVLQPGGACSQQNNACTTSQSCVGFLQCLQGCSTQTCVNQCVQSNPQGVALYNAVVDCICGEGCETECAADCGGGSRGSGGSGNSPTCNVPSSPPSQGACAAQFPCNPVTNAGCPTGYACDLAQGGFACYEPPNNAALCGNCNNQGGPFCQGGLTCAGTQCAKFCCDSADCGGATCNKSVFGANSPVGVCLGTGSGGSSGAGGTSGAGGSGGSSGAGGSGGSGAGGSGVAGTGTGGTDPGTAGSGTAGTDAQGQGGSDPQGQGGQESPGGSPGQGQSGSGGQGFKPSPGDAVESDGGCGCRTSPAPRSGVAGILPLLLGLLLRRRRR